MLTASQYEDIITRKNIFEAEAAVATESQKYGELAQKLERLGNCIIRAAQLTKSISDDLTYVALETVNMHTIKPANAIAESSTLIRVNLMDTLNISDFNELVTSIDKIIEPFEPNNNNWHDRSNFMTAAYSALETGKCDGIIRLENKAIDEIQNDSE